MEGLIRSFLWGQQGSKRIHWVNWDTICQPIEEGGLGIRRLQDTKYILRGKLAWKVMDGSSLWARFIRTKYGMDQRRGEMTPKATSSILWKHIWPHFARLQKLSRWIVQKGDVDFWRDNVRGKVLDKKKEIHDDQGSHPEPSAL